MQNVQARLEATRVTTQSSEERVARSLQERTEENGRKRALKGTDEEIEIVFSQAKENLQFNEQLRLKG